MACEKYKKKIIYISTDYVYEGTEGEYNFAFRVVEWRKVGDQWFKLGHVTRDMQVIIDASDNERPLLEVLDPICVEAGTLIRDTVSGEDPNFDDILNELDSIQSVLCISLGSNFQGNCFKLVAGIF